MKELRVAKTPIAYELMGGQWQQSCNVQKENDATASRAECLQTSNRFFLLTSVSDVLLRLSDTHKMQKRPRSQSVSGFPWFSRSSQARAAMLKVLIALSPNLRAFDSGPPVPRILLRSTSNELIFSTSASAKELLFICATRMLASFRSASASRLSILFTKHYLASIPGMTVLQINSSGTSWKTSL